MMRHPALPTALLAILVLTGCVLTGCVPNGAADTSATVIAVESTADACTVDTQEAPAGTITFRVTNAGDSATEFYLLGADEVSIVAEVENIAPDTSRDLTVVVAAGEYVTVCKPGMVGSGLGQARFTVTATP